jgi:predicted nucleic acid-binding protein
MDLVLDANVLLSALIKEGLTRAIILSGTINLYAPEFLLEELTKHIDVIVKKSGMSRVETESYTKRLFETAEIRVFATPEVDKFMSRAEAITPDLYDKDYFALALKLGCPIWSNDKKLKGQSKVKVYSTKEVAELVSQM